MKREKRKKRKRIELDWKDYIAITIALLETVFLPVILCIIVLLSIAFLFSLF